MEDKTHTHTKSKRQKKQIVSPASHQEKKHFKVKGSGGLIKGKIGWPHEAWGMINF